MNINMLLNNIQHIGKKKIPKTKTKHIGIEFEFISPMVGRQLDIIFSSSPWAKCFNLGYDISIKSSKHYGHELRVLCKEIELKECLKELQKLFVAAKAYVNKSCGLHVHLDMRQRDFIKSYNKLMEAQTLMFSVVDPTRKRNKYCKLQTVKNIKYIKNRRYKPEIVRWETSPYTLFRHPIYATADKYSAINPVAYKQHKTIEVRVHEGTVNTTDVYNWCMFLISCLKSKEKITHTNYLKVGSLPPSIKTYLTKRIKQNDRAIK